MADAPLEAKLDELLSIARGYKSIAGGLTNYIEDRPELTRAEREMEVLDRRLDLFRPFKKDKNVCG